MCVHDTDSMRDKLWQKKSWEKESGREKKGSREKRSSCGFVGFTINPVKWWRLAHWWFNIPLHALYGTYNGPDVTMETKHASQEECSLNFSGKSAKACITCLNSHECTKIDGNASIWSFHWRRVNLALECLVLCESHNPCRENEWESGRATESKDAKWKRQRGRGGEGEGV